MEIIFDKEILTKSLIAVKLLGVFADPNKDDWTNWNIKFLYNSAENKKIVKGFLKEFEESLNSGVNPICYLINNLQVKADPLIFK